MELGLPLGIIAGMVMMFAGVIGWVLIIMNKFDEKFKEDWEDQYE